MTRNNEFRIGGMTFSRVGQHQQSENNSQKIPLLLDWVDELNHQNEMTAICRTICRAMQEVMDARMVALKLYPEDEHRQQGYFYSRRGPFVSNGGTAEDTRLRRWVLDHKLPLIANEDLHSAMISDYYQALNEERITPSNMILAPVLNREKEVIGIIEAVDCRYPAKLGESDLSVVYSLTSHAASAILRGQSWANNDQKLRKQDMYLTEIHHRVKNDLAMISGIVEIESLELENEEAREVLSNVQHRIKSMAVVYELLSDQDTNQTQADLGRYFEKLVQGVARGLNYRKKKVNITVEADTVVLDPYKSLSCGLILNELLLNSYKHAFEGREEGEVRVEVESKGSMILMSYLDDGPGLPDDFQLEEQQSIGFKMVEALVTQLDGTLNILREPGSGAHFEIAFPANGAARPPLDRPPTESTHRKYAPHHVR